MNHRLKVHLFLGCFWLLFQTRVFGQDETAVAEPSPKQLTCDYGTGTEVTTCSFEINEELSHPTMRWKVGTGITAFWLGGPLKDRSSMENTGGYLYLDTSYKQVNKVFSTAALESGEPESVYIGRMDRPNDPSLSSSSSSLTTTIGQIGSIGSSATTASVPAVFKSALMDARSSLNATGWTRDPISTRQYERQFIQEVLNNSRSGSDSSSSNRFASGQQTSLSSSTTNVITSSTGDHHDQDHHGDHHTSLNENRTSSALIRDQLLPLSIANFDNGNNALLIAGRDHQLSLSGQTISMVPNSGSILSPNISATGPMGNCLRFYYNMDGLSADRLRILVLDYVTGVNQTLWETNRQTEGEWVKVEVSYAYDSHHKIVLEGVAKDINSPERAYRGYVAIDDFSYAFLDEDSPGMCHGHCTFEGGLCGWSNVPDEDDFDWNQGRGSDNFYTGPSRDFHSFSREFPLGGYLYIDASYPRRPGDRALLRSPQFPAPATSEKNVEQEQKENYGPICLKFATHMFGNGIGTLRVKVRSEDSEAAAGDSSSSSRERVLWEMSGEAGNRWQLAQLSYAATTPYHFIFEGIIGPNYLGNIAIDSILIEQGACPISPQTASRKSGDCTFEESECAWTNPRSSFGLDQFDWIRQFGHGSYGPRTDHTLSSLLGHYMSLNGDSSLQRGGSWAWLISPEFQIQGGGTGQGSSATTAVTSSPLAKCMSFYYYMYQRAIEPGGPSLGGIRIYIRTLSSQGDVILLPMWRLNNHQSMRWRRAQVLLNHPALTSQKDSVYQTVVEGVWGDARVGAIAVDDITFFEVTPDSDLCKTLPDNAGSVDGECSFDRTLCGWRNDTLHVNGKAVNVNSHGQLDSLRSSKSSLISHKISHTSGGVAGLVGSSHLSHHHNQPGSSLIANDRSFALSGSKPLVSWRLATINSRPANLQDHTFRAPVGYVYFDVFNQHYLQQPTLRSMRFSAMTGDEPVKMRCLSFWFSAFGRGDNSVLSVYAMKLEETEGSSDSGTGGSGGGSSGDSLSTATGSDGEKVSSDGRLLLWSIQSRFLETRRNLWYYAQTAVNAETEYQILFQGEATDGGFAIDDITFYNGTCTTRPTEAMVKMKSDESSS